MTDCERCKHPQDHHGDRTCDGSWEEISETCGCAGFMWPDESPTTPPCSTCRHPKSWHTSNDCMGNCPCDIRHYEEDLMTDDKTRDLAQQTAQLVDALAARLDDISETIRVMRQTSEVHPARYRANMTSTSKGLPSHDVTVDSQDSGIGPEAVEVLKVAMFERAVARYPHGVAIEPDLNEDITQEDYR